MEIALALGSGGTKGYAHIGVLRALDRHGIHIGALAGTSIGALIGALYLAGNAPDAIEERLSDIETRRLFKRGSDAGQSLLGLAGVEELLDDVLGDRTFEDLSIPFAMVAVDLVTGQEVHLRKGRLVDAVMASIALPGIFPPREIEDYQLVDGGISNPVPVDVARELGEGLPVVAVALSKPPRPGEEMPTPDVLEPVPIIRHATSFRWGQAINIFIRSIFVSGALITEHHLAAEKPEVVIRPDVHAISLLDQPDVPEVVKLGEQAAEQALPEIKRHLHWRRQLIRRVGLGSVMRRLSRNGR